jgi:fucose 4-O-acetylase-like acetyltransferase
MSFLLTLLVIWTHALNTELFLGEAGKNSAAGLTESLLGEHLAQIAVPGFFMMSAVLFFRNYRPADTARKWGRRFKSLVIPYFSWNLLYYLGYLIATRAPVLREITGREETPFSLQELLEAVLFYKYNHVFWFVFQLILLALLSPLIWYIVQQRAGFTGMFLLLCVFIFLKADPTPLNADALLYYMTGARAVTALSKNPPRGRRSQRREEEDAGAGMSAVVPRSASVKTLRAGLVFMVAALFFYCIALLSGNDLPLVLSRLMSAASLWTLLLCLRKLPAPRPIMYETFLIYAIHFAPVRLINKSAAALLPGSASAALLVFLLMPLIVLGIAWIVNSIGERCFPVLLHLFTGGR